MTTILVAFLSVCGILVFKPYRIGSDTKSAASFQISIFLTVFLGAHLCHARALQRCRRRGGTPAGMLVHVQQLSPTTASSAILNDVSIGILVLIVVVLIYVAYSVVVDVVHAIERTIERLEREKTVGADDLREYQAKRGQAVSPSWSPKSVRGGVMMREDADDFFEPSGYPGDMAAAYVDHNAKIQDMVADLMASASATDASDEEEGPGARPRGRVGAAALSPLTASAVRVAVDRGVVTGDDVDVVPDISMLVQAPADASLDPVVMEMEYAMGQSAAPGAAGPSAAAENATAVRESRPSEIFSQAMALFEPASDDEAEPTLGVPARGAAKSSDARAAAPTK